MVCSTIDNALIEGKGEEGNSSVRVADLCESLVLEPEIMRGSEGESRIFFLTNLFTF